MAPRPLTLRTCLALLLAVALAFAGVSGSGSGQAGADPQPLLSQMFSGDALHTGMMRTDSGAPGQQENCDHGAPCCPGQHHSCVALPGSHAFEFRGAKTGAEFVSTPPLDRPLRPPFRPPIG